jgi:hypothetical protein
MGGSVVRMCAPIQMRDANTAYVLSQRGTFEATFEATFEPANGLYLVEEMVVVY